MLVYNVCMLYIIFGASRTGKTMLARKLLYEKSIPYFQLDYFITALEAAKLPTPVVQGEDFIEKAEKTWPSLKAMLIHISREADNYVIEGDPILPKFVHELHNLSPGRIRVVCLGYPNIAAHEKLSLIRMYKHIDDWTDSYTDDEMLPMVNDMIEFSNYLEKECGIYSIPFYDTGKNFEDVHAYISEYLMAV